ncbi:MAG: hypothetical protein HFJ40_00930 [Clostridia bacterium]|nr:hypothetical protein [Clostridia bacterium]
MMKKMIVLISTIVVCILIFMFFTYKKTYFNTFSLNSDSKYIVTTDSAFMTMLDDGGSYRNTYYEINLSENIIKKKEDNYNKNLSDSLLKRNIETYEGKVLSKQEINSEQNNRLRELFDYIVNDVTDRRNINTSYYLSSENKSKIEMTDEEKEEFIDIISK